MSELKTKLERLAALMADRGAGALRIAQGGNLAWLTGGHFLVSERGAPIAEALVKDGALTVLTNDIEAQRLRDEEVPEGVTVESYPWYDAEAKEALVARLLGGAKAQTDSDIDLYEVRTPLLASEQARFKALGQEASSTVTDVLGALEQGFSEKGVATRVRAALEDSGLACPVLLVAGEARFGRYRHPIPKNAPFGRVGLVVVCAERGGLIVSLSRTVAFGRAPAENRERLTAVLEVEKAMWDATRPGTPVAEVLAAAQAAYARVGFPKAWQEHHQGGPAGYLTRDFLATPGERRPVMEGAVYAWNPSLPQAKSEDSVLLTDEGLVNLSFDPRWPSMEVGGRPRPGILEL